MHRIVAQSARGPARPVHIQVPPSRILGNAVSKRTSVACNFTTDEQTNSTSSPASAITVELDDLRRDDLNLEDAIHQAYGDSGIGIMMVKMDDEFLVARKRLLEQAQALMDLPSPVLQRLERAKTKYSIGWNQNGQEWDGLPSGAWERAFYANPEFNWPVGGSEELIALYPAFYHPNVWPTSDLPGLEEAFMALGGAMTKAGAMVAAQCGRYVQKHGCEEAAGLMEDALRTAVANKAQLRYSTGNGKDSTAAGWSRNHTALTGMAAPMVTSTSGQAAPTAPLLVRPAAEREEHLCISIPEDCVVFSIGEAFELLSSGRLRPQQMRCPVPCYGPACACAGCACTSFSVFLQPNPEFKLVAGTGGTPAEKLRQQFGGRWKPKCTYGAFTNRTIRRNQQQQQD